MGEAAKGSSGTRSYCLGQTCLSAARSLRLLTIMHAPRTADELVPPCSLLAETLASEGSLHDRIMRKNNVLAFVSPDCIASMNVHHLRSAWVTIVVRHTGSGL